jgi:hypothetical protein
LKTTRLRAAALHQAPCRRALSPNNNCNNRRALQKTNDRATLPGGLRVTPYIFLSRTDFRNDNRMGSGQCVD